MPQESADAVWKRRGHALEAQSKEDDYARGTRILVSTLSIVSGSSSSTNDLQADEDGLQGRGCLSSLPQRG